MDLSDIDPGCTGPCNGENTQSVEHDVNYSENCLTLQKKWDLYAVH